MIHSYPPYTEILHWQNNQALPESLTVQDHLNGYNENLINPIFTKLNTVAGNQQRYLPVTYHQILDQQVKSHYSNLDIKFDANFQDRLNLNKLRDYNIHPTVDFKNFLCSFNGSDHVSRKFLVSIINKFKWFDATYCSKNFCYTEEVIDGHLADYLLPQQQMLYNKFFLGNEDFFETKYSFGHVRFEHDKNIYNLEDKLTQSFIHIVSETMATSYYPFVTEKFLYSVVIRGLFLAYAQPGWHAHLEKYYGFKRYTKLFDYRFDSIQNPVERLVELMSMISKFSVLSLDDWRDLYLLEQDTIEYNYNHYFSNSYLEQLKKYG